MSLSHKDAEIIMGMLERGDKNHDIAAWFGENPARVAEVKDGTAFGTVKCALKEELPPRGAVGPKARRLRAYVRDAIDILNNNGASGIEHAIKELQDGLTQFEKHES